MVERTSQLLTQLGVFSHVAIGLDLIASELAILFEDKKDIDHLLAITQLGPRSPVSTKARELYEGYGLPRANLVNFQNEEIEGLHAALKAFTEGVAFA